MHYFSRLFNEILKTLRYLFAGFGEMHKFLRNFEKILKIFAKNSLEKYNFKLYLEMLLQKIDPPEITPFFDNFSIRRKSLPSPWRRL